MYYDKELLMIQNYADELDTYIHEQGRNILPEAFNRVAAKIWATNEIINQIAMEDAAVPYLLMDSAPYSVPILVQCFMFDMEYNIRISTRGKNLPLWQAGYDAGREILNRLKALS